MAKRLVLTILLLIALPGAATAQSGKIISYVIRSGGKAVQFVLEHKGELGLHLLGATVFEVGKSSLGFAETTPAECNLYDAKVLTCPDKINPGLFLGSATPPEKLDPASPKDRARVQDLLRQNQTSLDGVLHRAPITLPKLTPLADPPALFADMPELNRLLKPLPQTATPPATPPNAVPYVPPTATLGLGVDTIPAWRRGLATTPLPSAVTPSPAPNASPTPLDAPHLWGTTPLGQSNSSTAPRTSAPSPVTPNWAANWAAIQGTAPASPPPATSPLPSLLPAPQTDYTNLYRPRPWTAPSPNSNQASPPAAATATPPDWSRFAALPQTGSAPTGLAPSGGGGIGVRDFTLVNHSGDKFTAFSYKEPNSTGWRQAASFPALDADYKRLISFSDLVGPCHLDLKLTFADSSEHVWPDLNLCQTKSVTIYFNREKNAFIASWD
jgi:hypothetical protein